MRNFIQITLILLALSIPSKSAFAQSPAQVAQIIGLISDIATLMSSLNKKDEPSREERLLLNYLGSDIQGTLVTINDATQYSKTRRIQVYQNTINTLNQAIENSRKLTKFYTEDKQLTESLMSIEIAKRLLAAKIFIHEAIGEAGVAKQYKTAFASSIERLDQEFQPVVEHHIDLCISREGYDFGNLMAASCTSDPITCGFGAATDGLIKIYDYATRNKRRPSCTKKIWQQIDIIRKTKHR